MEELSKMQIAELRHIQKKGFAAYSKRDPENEELVSMGYLTSKPIGPFGEIGYTLTSKGAQFINTLKD